MKKLIIILSLLFIGNTCLSQKDSTLLNNQLDLDVHFLAVELNYKRTISKKFSVGAGFLLGLTGSIHLQNEGGNYFYDPINKKSYGSRKSNWEVNSNHFEIVGFKGYIDYKVSNNFHFHLGPKVIPLNLTESTEWYRSIELGIFFNSGNVEVGLKPTFGNIDGNLSISLPFFLLKINLRNW